ncbi:hypothetical protein BBP00_00005963 [Phytophthora kernoviae]|uniref:Neutral zinc metallopeptidase n=1 Tax=Phytophthora kernoviae TaxID=325452 RepID=A0A3F2RN43_9STRA|nr:hypothetical protein BBP00_00005963 [Phytophthora kernoviae]
MNVKNLSTSAAYYVMLWPSSYWANYEDDINHRWSIAGDPSPAENGWSDTSACKSEPFDVFLQPKKGLDGGFGYDYGQAVNQEDMLANIDGDQLTIIAHEIGHGFGLPDFYEANEQPGTDFPNCLMKAGSSMTVTDSDGWMLRRVLEHLKPRYNF